MTDREIPNVFPLMFGFNDLMMGRGFVAEVTTDGRATMAQEEGEWWMSGVNPGGVAASGATVAEALANFRNTYRLVLTDSAMLANSFEEFSRDVQGIFASTTQELIEEWKAAAMAIREGAAAGPFQDLQRRFAIRLNAPRNRHQNHAHLRIGPRDAERPQFIGRRLAVDGQPHQNPLSFVVGEHG